MSIWLARLSVKVVSKVMSWFSPSFSGAVDNATALALLLESFAVKKRTSRGVSANTARSLRFFFLEALRF